MCDYNQLAVEQRKQQQDDECWMKLRTKQEAFQNRSDQQEQHLKNKTL